MLLFALVPLLAVQSTGVRIDTVPTPPVYVPTPVAARSVDGMPRIVPFPIDVDIRSGTAVLWRGSMMVSKFAAATINQTIRQSPVSVCDEATSRARIYAMQIDTGITATLQPERYDDSDVPRFRVTVKWTRANESSCTTGVGTRTVELSDYAVIQPGKTVELKGDGGLTIRLTRP